MNVGTDKLVAEAKIGIVFYDYDERKIARVPKLFHDAFITRIPDADSVVSADAACLHVEVNEHA